jgi:hypothetical protein
MVHGRRCLTSSIISARNLFQVIAKATHSIGAFFGGVEVKVPIDQSQRRS